MGYRILLFFTAIFMMIFGANIMLTKHIPQGKHNSLPDLDLTLEPFIAYGIGGLICIYGIYIFYYLWNSNDKDDENIE